jgi:hypothetical protein
MVSADIREYSYKGRYIFELYKVNLNAQFNLLFIGS